jgi:hypothetical protein
MTMTTQRGWWNRESGRRRLWWLLALACACSTRDPSPNKATRAETAAAAGSRFTDITASAGIDAVHANFATEERLLPETMGAGAAFFDADDDGLVDLFVVAGGPIAGAETGHVGRLFKNLGGGRFEDVTASSGLDGSLLGMGAAVGDFDNDGLLDLFVSGVGEDRLFRNLGSSRFEDASERLGSTAPGFGSSAAFLDADNDGWLDLVAARYVTWTPETDIPCSPDGQTRVYCTPEVYTGASNRFFHNDRGERFVDTTASSGLELPEGKTLGVAILDLGADRAPDIAVANDTVRNFLFRNRGDGTFEEIGTPAGIAYSESGATRGGMGIDIADVDGDGHPDVAIGNFSQEMAALYRGKPGGLYVDDAAQLGIGVPTLLTLAFGTRFADFDGDTQPDLLIANGHIEPEIESIQKLQRYAQPAQLFWNRGEAGFLEATPAELGPLADPMVGRGLATADIDLDGDLDVVITQNGGATRLLRNDSPPGRWLRLRLIGHCSNRTSYGAVVTLAAGERRLSRSLVSGGSYLSASEPVVTIPLGDLVPDRLEVTWPAGTVLALDRPELDREHRLEEPCSKEAAGANG